MTQEMKACPSCPVWREGDSMETERAILTLLTHRDFTDVLDMFNDPDTSTYIRHLHRRSVEDYKAVLLARLDQIKHKVGFHWVARLKETGIFVGAVNISPIPGTAKMQLGFQLKKEFWNKGFATELAGKALEAGLKEKRISPIYGVFEKDNVASRRVLEKLGFEADHRAVHTEKNIVTYLYSATQAHRAAVV